MTVRPCYGQYLLRTDHVPGEEPLPYVKTGRKIFIAGLVMAFHAALILVPMIFLAISEMIKPPVYVMRLPTVDHVPSEQPASPHPSPLNKKSTGTPEKGKPLSDIPEIPELVPPVEPPPPQPQPETPKKTPVPTKTDPIAPKPVPDSRKTAPVETKVKPPQKSQSKPKNTLLSASDIKISRKRVKNPNRTSAQPVRPSAAERARNARNQQLARQLRSLTGEVGGTGTPGGGGGPKGVVSKEVNDYYYRIEAFLKRRWNQPSIYGGDRPKVVILFRVAANGGILSARIQERSGNAAMDASVEQLLRSLTALPAPPQAMEFTVTMEIDR